MVRSQDGAFWHSHLTLISMVDPSLKTDGEKGAHSMRLLADVMVVAGLV
jgi:hypothetical protein